MLGTASPDTSGMMNRSGRTIAVASNSGSPCGSAGASGFAATSAAMRFSFSSNSTCKILPTSPSLIAGHLFANTSTNSARALGSVTSSLWT